jgi:hypothetical protein
VLVLTADSPLHAALAALAATARVVVVAGLPGSGKSLLIHQLAQLAHGRGRAVSLLQWDVARPVVEGSRAARAYPASHGVTHGMVRVAVGRWARGAIAAWDSQRPAHALLVVEAPFVGHRLVELARPTADAAEALLSGPRAPFIVPVPSRTLRAHLEAERVRRALAPRHPREREDAPPDVLRDLWRQLARLASTLGLAPRSPGSADPPYDPAIYAAVYGHVLRRRNMKVLSMDAVLPADALSPYEFGIPVEDLRPTPEEASGLVDAAAREWADPDALATALERWYVTPE